MYFFLFQLSKPVEGLKEWLDAVSTARIPCAVVSSLDRINMTEALERMELKKYFQVGVLLNYTKLSNGNYNKVECFITKPQRNL